VKVDTDRLILSVSGRRISRFQPTRRFIVRKYALGVKCVQSVVLEAFALQELNV